MPLLAVYMPANVVLVFRGLSDVVNLEILDKQKIYDFTFGRFVSNRILESDQTNRRMLTAQSYNNSAIYTLGYALTDTMRNLLLAALFVAIFLVLIVLLKLIKRFCYKRLPTKV